MIVLAALVGVLAARYRVAHPGGAAPWLMYTDFAVGALGCLALCWRLRFPVALTAALAVLSVFAETVTGPLLVALFTVAVHRPTRVAVSFLAAALLAFGGFVTLRPEPTVSVAWVLAFGVTGYYVAVAWGMVVRSRRELVASLRERAAAAEIEAQLRAESRPRRCGATPRSPTPGWPSAPTKRSSPPSVGARSPTPERTPPRAAVRMHDETEDDEHRCSSSWGGGDECAIEETTLVTRSRSSTIARCRGRPRSSRGESVGSGTSGSPGPCAGTYGIGSTHAARKEAQVL